MSDSSPTKRRAVTDSWARRLPAATHVATLVAGFAVLLFLARDQWFYFDEWDIIWPEEGERRAVEGHNGHWSVVPIAVWRMLQNTFGLASYLPFIVVAILSHVAVTHLLWRLLRRVGVAPWLAVAMGGVFMLLGAAGENLFWAFQMGFMGAIAFGLGALLVVMGPAMTVSHVVGSAALLSLGAATAGTALPLFVPVALVLLIRHGWRTAAITLAFPAAAYAIWYLFVAGPNPTAIFRATGIQALLADVPIYIGTLFVDGLGSLTPVPGFGIVLCTAIAAWGIVMVGRRPAGVETMAVLGLLAAALVFAALTAYSRVGLGPESAAESRYVYLLAVTTAPTIALLLTRLSRSSAPRQIAVLALLAVVGAYNVGLLLAAAAESAATEQQTHRVISAALDIAEEHPLGVDPLAKPEPVLVPRTLGQLEQLESEFGLTRIPYDESDFLTALANVSLDLTPGETGQGCEIALEPGSSFALTAEGRTIDAPAGGDIALRLQVTGAAGATRTLSLVAGSNELTVAEPVTVVVEAFTGTATLCG